MPRICEDWIQSYLRYTTMTEAPEKFHFWTAVSTIAGALRRKVKFNQINYEWSPNFYIILVAPPAVVTKSTTAGIGMSMLREIDGVTFGPNAMTWQFLPGALEDCRIDYPMGGGFYPMSCLTFESSELGNLIDPRDRAMIDLLVDLWDGKAGQWVKATKGSGTNSIVNPWINIIACTTPSWLNENFPRGMIGGGFASRCIFTYADRKRQIIPYPRKFITEEGFKLRQALVNDLKEIATIAGEYTLTTEAEEFGEKWCYAHAARLEETDDTGRLGFIGRMQCHIHKLAMILSAAKGNSLEIQLRELVAATKLVEDIEADTAKVFRAVDTKEPIHDIQKVIDFVLRNKKVNRMALYRNFMHMFKSAAEFDEAILAGSRAGMIAIRQEGANIMIEAVA